MDFLNKLKNLNLGSLGNLFGKKGDDTQVGAEPKVIKEINLVPDIKDDFIKALRFRNLVFFICIVVAISSTVVILIFLTIAGGQQGFINAKQNTIDALQKKIEEYSDLSDFLTIRDQLSNIAAITEQKKVVSRTFNILSALIPTGPDTVNISKLNINLSEEVEAPTFSIEAQANAGTEPFIDYNVLDSFKKSMDYMRYDYGEYVDKNDQTIPAYCIIENAIDGSVLYDNAKGYYAYWLIEGEGCNPSAKSDGEEEENNTNPTNSSNSIWDQILNNENTDDSQTLKPQSDLPITEIDGYKIEQYQDQNVVRIWRTPQYAEWYKSNPGEGEAYMTLDGEIHNVPHFNSFCIKYSGTESEDNNQKVTWSVTNDTCLLVPNQEDEEGGEVSGINITESTNGRNSDDGELVLRFDATIVLAPEVFNFNNHHMLAIPPSGRRNVTDSYLQIQSIFAKRAEDCSKDDAECNNTPTSSSGSSGSNNSNNSNNSNESNTNNNDSDTENNEDNTEEDYEEEEEE